MSRIGKQPIEIPQEAKVEVDGNQILVSGPKGSQTFQLRSEVKVELEDGKLVVKRKNDSKMAKSLHGLTRTLISNIVVGVTRGWEKTLEVAGTGFAAKTEGEKLVLKLGFSHPVEFTPSEGVSFSVAEGKIKVTGVDKAKVGELAARIRSTYPPNVYSGKGVRYLGEALRKKPGKAAKAIGG